MKKLEWAELEFTPDLTSDRARELLTKTQDEHEHPDGYNGPCECRECMSCADV
jgi:hypothetical protein